MIDEIILIISNITHISNLNITKDSKLKDDLKIDSFDFILILTEIEEHFKVDVDMDEISNINTIYDLTQYCINKVK